MIFFKGEGVSDRDISEYRVLYAALLNLHEKLLKRKQEVRYILDKTAERRREAYLALEKANRFTKHLTANQRNGTGISYHPGDIKARISQCNSVIFHSHLVEEETLPDLLPGVKQEFKKMGLAILGLINNIKKKLIQLDLLEMRCRELILSINKALEAFRHEWEIIYRRIYPMGFFSSCYRSLRRLFGQAYFSYRDLVEISALGKMTTQVLKIADSPII